MKVGDILIAIDECKTGGFLGNALIIGKHYPIVEIDAKNVYIESEIANLHSFKIKTLSEFFKQGKPENQPKGEMSKLIEWIEQEYMTIPESDGNLVVIKTAKRILEIAIAIQNGKKQNNAK